MQPLDLVKTRFQIQHSDAPRYRSVVDCMVKVCRDEGVLSLYKGMLPPILAETPKRATKFFTFEQYKALLGRLFDGWPQAVRFSLAGLLCGATEALVVNPFETVKVRLQADRKISVLEQKSSFQTARIIVAEGGFGTSGLNRGLTSCMIRNGVWNMIYFGLYHSAKLHLLNESELKRNLHYRFALGFLSGTAACLGNTPFDVVKSRIQAGGLNGKYKTCLQSIATVYREEGFRALYKGLVPKVMRLGPGGAILMVIYEYMFDLLKLKFG
uniref:Mitochondrial 2-oxodicarboxylate carrier n=1 Tax=Trichuris muris TaxID=70415 RepID=A0A5S6R0L4_TRIMR